MPVNEPGNAGSARSDIRFDAMFHGVLQGLLRSDVHDLSLSRLWYTGPPLQGGTTDGQCPVSRCADPSHGVPGFDQLDPRGVSAVGAALRGRVPGAYGRLAPRWETAHRSPVYRVQELPLSDAGRSAVLHSGLPENLCAPG